MAIDLIVGIDVGMSGTGVAYRLPKTGNPEFDVVCLKWGSDNKILKVPTKLAYPRTGQSQSPLHWGLSIPDDTSNLLIREWFKTKLGEHESNPTATEKLYADYLKCLHDELAVRFVRDGILGKAWVRANISFVFSTPACWDPSVVAQFKVLVSKAGFEQARGKLPGCGLHTVAITMTEPQATAAFELHTPKPVANLKRGHNVMIVDVGGGTGDFSLVEVATNAQHAFHWREHQPTMGEYIGSTHIDQGFEKRVTDILKPHQHLLGHTARHVAWEMRRSIEFLEAKHDFEGADADARTIPVPHLENPESIHDDFVQKGELANPGAELERLFDQQIKKITDCISERRRQLNEPLHYLLLSGGLGSSPYVERRLKTFCNDDSMLQSTKLVVSNQPQLAVCMGLVYAASKSQAVFPKIACRASFGLVCRIPSATPAKRTWTSTLTRGKGIQGRFDDCVDWIIPKGKQIENGKELEFTRKVFFELDEPRVCNVEIATSLADGPSPPKDSIAIHEVMRANLLEAEEKKKRKVFWRKEYFYQIDFKIKATVGLAEATFMCVDAGGKKISESVTVPVPREPPIMGLDGVEGE